MDRMDEARHEPTVSVETGGGVDSAEALSHADVTPGQAVAEGRHQSENTEPSEKAAFNPFATTSSGNPFSIDEKKNYSSVPHPTASAGPKHRKDVLIQVQEFSGWPIPAERFIQLEQAFKQANLDRSIPTWVCQTSESIQILINATTGKPVKTPLEAGYQQVNYPFLSMAYRLMAYFGKMFLKCQVTDNMLMLANGAQLSLSASAWLDANGNPIQLYQVRGLPDGTWIKLAQQCSEERISLKNQKALRKLVEAKLAKQEEAGKIRESGITLKIGSSLPSISTSQSSHSSHRETKRSPQTQTSPANPPGAFE